MTQHEKLLRYMVDHPQGVTIRECCIKLNINWTHKRVAELVEMGVQIKRLDESREGTAYRRFQLADVKQERIGELLKIWEMRRKVTA